MFHNSKNNSQHTAKSRKHDQNRTFGTGAKLRRCLMQNPVCEYLNCIGEPSS